MVLPFLLCGLSKLKKSGTNSPPVTCPGQSGVDLLTTADLESKMGLPSPDGVQHSGVGMTYYYRVL